MTPQEALKEFVDTINATGGVRLNRKGLYEPLGDSEWVDLGHAYVSACRALGVEPIITKDGVDG